MFLFYATRVFFCSLFVILKCIMIISSGRHTDSVASVAFSTDGSLVATGCYGGVLKVWEAATGALKNVLEGPGDIEWLT